MQNNAILEVCASNIESARAAAQGGADRIELCTRLDLDGLTPSAEEIREARAIEGIRLNVLIRCKEGGFVYTEDDFALMQEQVALCKSLGVDGVVIGALTEEGDIDVAHCQKLVQSAQGMEITFHRAFDVCHHPRQALEDIIALGCHRLLTSGQQPTAEAGIPLLQLLHQQAQGRIIIMPGSGVNPSNAGHILRATGCTEIHSSARHPGDSVTSAEVVSAICREIKQ